MGEVPLTLIRGVNRKEHSAKYQAMEACRGTMGGGVLSNSPWEGGAPPVEQLNEGTATFMGGNPHPFKYGGGWSHTWAMEDEDRSSGMGEVLDRCAPKEEDRKEDLVREHGTNPHGGANGNWRGRWTLAKGLRVATRWESTLWEDGKWERPRKGRWEFEEVKDAGLRRG